MYEGRKVACFTGHRPKNLPFGFREDHPECKKLKARLSTEIERLITEQGVCHFISGMALGVDVFCAEIVLALKEKYPEITLESAIPCETQAIKWKLADRERYYDILGKCDKETMLQAQYTSNCMQKRNQYMVSQSDFVIAVWNGTPSGTGNTVKYAREMGKTVICIHPITITTEEQKGC